LKKKFYQVQSQMEADVSVSLRKFLVEAFPVINNTYQIGNPISPSASSVFKGLDLNTFDLVAIKAFPSVVNLDTSLKHDTLVPVIGRFLFLIIVFLICYDPTRCMLYRRNNICNYEIDEREFSRVRETPG
jgi:hypothetical protein